MILFILGMASLTHLVTDLLQPLPELPNKPFKCNMCLGFWLSIIPASALYGWEGILVSAITGIVSETIYKHIV